MKKFLSILLALTLCLSCTAAIAETIVIGATPSPHAEILEFVREDLAALGYDLEIVIFTEYPLPNPALAAGELDANYFQHIPYLTQYNDSVAEDEQLIPAIGVHYEPFGIYAGTKATLEDIAEGDTITITNDPSNETRALLLLRDAGLIKLAEDATWESALTTLDIVENPYNLEIVEVNAELLPSTLEDAAFAVINGNFAIGAGLSPAEDAIFLEPLGSESAEIYTNYVVVRQDSLEAPFLEALESVLLTEKVRDYMLTNEAYAGGVVPSF